MFSNKAALFGTTIFGILVVVIVFFRLFYLQVIEGDKFVKMVERQSDPRFTIKADRGYIYDNEGRLLAGNKNAYDVYAYGKDIRNKEYLYNVLRDNGVRVTSKMKNSLSKGDQFTYLARGVDLQRAKRILKKVDGVDSYAVDTRFYPQGTLMANVVGFTGVDNEGRTGVEYFLDKDLEGKEFHVLSLKDSRRRIIMLEDKRELSKADTSVYLTISSRIQGGVEYLLRKGAENFRAKNGSVVAMDIKTGEIILSASVKGFNPHLYWKSPVENWQNHAFNYVFEPGSIFKTVAFSYLHNGNKLDRNRIIDTSKKVKIGKYTYSDTKYYGMLTVDEIFTHSSNIGMTHLMKNEDKMAFHEFLISSGFGHKTGIYGASEEAGIIKDVRNWSKTSITSMAIGYEVLVTPLQMLRFYAAIANNGIMVNPKIISKIVKHDEVLKPNHEEKQILKPETAKYMLELMQKTVEAGTGVRAKTAITKVAGKTGTARIYDNTVGDYSTTNYTASFAGVFPAEDPKVAMVVIYEGPRSSIYGGSTSANIFREIAEFISTEKQYFEPELKVVANEN